MKPYLEKLREKDACLHVNANADYFFKPHFHSNLEILIVNKGVCDLQNNGKTYVVDNGKIAINDSYDIHGYGHNQTENADTRLIIIPLSFAKKFLSFKGDKTLKSNIIDCPSLCKTLTEIIDKLLTATTDQNLIKAGVDLFFAYLMQKIELCDLVQPPKHSLIKNILDYLNQNFNKDVTLPDVAKNFGYTEAHVSRIFHRYFGCSIGRYLNDLRIAYVLERLNDGSNSSVTNVIFEAGFNSIQTYYRNLARYKNNI